MRDFSYIDTMKEQVNRVTKVRENGFERISNIRSKFSKLDFIFDWFVRDLVLDNRHYFYTKDVRFSLIRDKVMSEDLIVEYLRLASYLSELLPESSLYLESDLSLFTSEVIDNYCLFDPNKGYIFSAESSKDILWITTPEIIALSKINKTRDNYRVGVISTLTAEYGNYTVLKEIGISHEELVSVDGQLSNSMAIVASHIPYKCSRSMLNGEYRLLRAESNLPKSKVVDSILKASVMGCDLDREFAEIEYNNPNMLDIDVVVRGCRSNHKDRVVMRFEFDGTIEGTVFGLYNIETGLTLSMMNPEIYDDSTRLRAFMYDLLNYLSLLFIKSFKGSKRELGTRLNSFNT